MAVTLTMQPESGDGVLTGHVVTAEDVPPARAASVAARPGAPRLLWRHHGPFIRPFIWPFLVLADGWAVSRVSPLAAQFLLAVIPVAVAARLCLRRTRTRLHVIVSLAAAAAWILAAGFGTGVTPWMGALLLAGGFLLAGTSAHDAARQRVTPRPAPPAPEPEPGLAPVMVASAPPSPVGEERQ